MQPESNEEREAWDVLHIRRSIGINDDHNDARLDALIREELKRHRYYEQVMTVVKRKMQIEN